MENDAKELDPVDFELPTGNQVQVVAGPVWREIVDVQRGLRQGKFYMIRIFSNEDRLDGRMVLTHEFRQEKDFDQTRLRNAWKWLEAMKETRLYAGYDCLDDFILEFSEVLERETLVEKTAVEHYINPVEIEPRDDFDPSDDSIYSDLDDARREDAASDRKMTE